MPDVKSDVEPLSTLALVVVDPDRLQGIIQASDLVQWLLQPWISQEPTA